MSRRLAASNASRQSSTRSGVVNSSAIGPLLGEVFGGSTTLIDVGVGRGAHDLAVFPQADPCGSRFNVRVASLHATLFPNDAVRHTITQIESLLQVMVVLIPH